MPPASTARITLPDRYRIVRHIANGGMAGVWEATDQLLGRSVAVKVLASHLSEDDRARRRFEREARAAAGLSSHPHVVTIYDVGEYDGRAFMVMELMPGGTVADRLRAGRTIADETALRWLREAAEALDAAHDQGVVHRDIKPGNLLLDDRDRLAIADFGIARLALEDQLTATGQVLGTASYISPEQAVGEPATAASDRYALAIVAFELLTGSRPFQAEHFAAQARAHVEDEPPLATERDPSLPRGVDAVLDRGLAKDPGDRWPSAGAMVAALDRAMGESPPATEPTRPIAPVPPVTPQRAGGGAWPWVLAGFAALVVIAVAGAVLLSGDDGGNAPPSAQPTARDRDRDRGAHAREDGHPRADREADGDPGADRDARPALRRDRPRPRRRPPAPGLQRPPGRQLRAGAHVLRAGARRLRRHQAAEPVRLRAVRARRRAQRAGPPGRGDPVPGAAAGPVRAQQGRREGAQGGREGRRAGLMSPRRFRRHTAI